MYSAKYIFDYWRLMFKTLLLIVSCLCMKNEAITLDSLKEIILSSYDLLPEYYLRFDISGFALHQNDLQKREFLA